ncbi:DUF255 domain-containing protein, partial [Enterococcus casseliflavus]
LLQHAHNPVDWFPWGDEAFEKAKRENKPVLVSIGYSTCHWCHVCVATLANRKRQPSKLIVLIFRLIIVIFYFYL